MRVFGLDGYSLSKFGGMRMVNCGTGVTMFLRECLYRAVNTFLESRYRGSGDDFVVSYGVPRRTNYLSEESICGELLKQLKLAEYDAVRSGKKVQASVNGRKLEFTVDVVDGGSKLQRDQVWVRYKTV